MDFSWGDGPRQIGLCIWEWEAAGLEWLELVCGAMDWWDFVCGRQWMRLSLDRPWKQKGLESVCTIWIYQSKLLWLNPLSAMIPLQNLSPGSFGYKFSCELAGWSQKPTLQSLHGTKPIDPLEGPKINQIFIKYVHAGCHTSGKADGKWASFLLPLLIVRCFSVCHGKVHILRPLWA